MSRISRNVTVSLEEYNVKSGCRNTALRFFSTLKCCMCDFFKNMSPPTCHHLLWDFTMPTTTTAAEWECGKGVTGVAEEAIKPSLGTSVTGHPAVTEHPLQAICGRLEIRNLPVNTSICRACGSLLARILHLIGQLMTLMMLPTFLSTKPLDSICPHNKIHEDRLPPCLEYAMFSLCILWFSPIQLEMHSWYSELLQYLSPSLT